MRIGNLSRKVDRHDRREETMGIDQDVHVVAHGFPEALDPRSATTHIAAWVDHAVSDLEWPHLDRSVPTLDKFD